MHDKDESRLRPRPRRSARGSAVLLLAALACVSCTRTGRQVPVPGSKVQTLDTIADEYVRLALALGERDPDSLDFAVVPEALRAEMHAQYITLDAIGNQADALRGQVEQVPAADAEARERTQFLELQLSAMTARTTMLRGRTLPFDQEARALFATSRLPDRWAAQRRAIRTQVLALLPPTGSPKTSPASPAARYAAYDRRFLVPPERLATVMNAALGACRQQTKRYLPLPAGESVELRFVRNQPWSAFSRYRGAGHSTISLNLDLPLTVDDVLELGCHEGYPGHHVFNTLREQALVAGRHRAEATVQTTFSPQSYVSEAAAAHAARLAFTLAERTEVERRVLFPLAGLPVTDVERYVRISSLVRGLASAEPAIMQDYLDDRLEFARATDVLARELLMAHAEALLLYVNEYRSYMLAYTDGPERVGVLLQEPGAEENYGQSTAATPEQQQARWARFRLMAETMLYRLP